MTSGDFLCFWTLYVFIGHDYLMMSHTLSEGRFGFHAVVAISQGRHRTLAKTYSKSPFIELNAPLTSLALVYWSFHTKILAGSMKPFPFPTSQPSIAPSGFSVNLRKVAWEFWKCVKHCWRMSSCATCDRVLSNLVGFFFILQNQPPWTPLFLLFHKTQWWLTPETKSAW